MAALIFMLLVVIVARKAYLVEGQKQCPPWFEWMNSSDSSGYCACAAEVPIFIKCDQKRQVSSLSQGSCIFYDSRDNRTLAYWCTFAFIRNATKKGMFSLPANLSELNDHVCGNLSREVKGPMCGRCTNNTGPSVYSVGSRCVPCSPVNILYYILLQYLPSTLIFLVLIFFRPNITSAPMMNYVIFCDSIVLGFRLNLWAYSQLDNNNVAISAVTLCSVWSFDALLFVSPPLCLSQHIQEIYIPFLELLATTYPFALLLLTYSLIQCHTNNFKPVVVLWRLFSRMYVHFYRSWDPSSSMIQAFASLFFLSYAKVAYLIWETFTWSKGITIGGIGDETVLYIDPNVPYLSTKHVLLMVSSVAVAVFVFLPPLLILVVYPTSLYRKISNWISPKWKLRIKTYVETFHGCLKDGTNGTRDYRDFAGWCIFLAGAVPQLLIVIISATVPSSLTNFLAPSYALAIYFSGLAFLCTLLQPYKERVANALTAGILTISSLICALSASVFNTRGNDVLFIVIVLILVPHCVLWGYVTWKITATLCCRFRAGKGRLQSVNCNRMSVFDSASVEPE